MPPDRGARLCGLCGHPIPPRSKLARTLTGASHAEVLAQLPVLSKDSKLALEPQPDGQFALEICMACWIDTGEGSRR